jgi:hypothetical protein
MALAFVDDSGSGGDSQYFVLAGYVTSEVSWSGFVPDWQSVLDLSPKLDYFKMSEAESLKGQFEGCSPHARDERLNQFADVILRYDPWEAAIAVPSKDYNEVLLPVLPKSRTSPYYSAFIAMVTALSGFYRWGGSDELVDFIFDEQDGMQTKAARQYGSFRGWYPNWRLGRIGFNDEKKVLPLQAADLIAWQTRRFMASKEGTRELYKRLHSNRPPYRKTLNRQMLKDSADAILKNLDALREEHGDARVDEQLEAIDRRNQRLEAKNAKKTPPTA